MAVDAGPRFCVQPSSGVLIPGGARGAKGRLFILRGLMCLFFRHFFGCWPRSIGQQPTTEDLSITQCYRRDGSFWLLARPRTPECPEQRTTETSGWDTTTENYKSIEHNTRNFVQPARWRSPPTTLSFPVCSPPLHCDNRARAGAGTTSK